MLQLFLLLGAVLSVAAWVQAGPAADAKLTLPEPLPHAHAHNDYEHTRPLLDALSHGFTGVEADIYLVDGKLLVAHNRDQVRAERTIEALYLDPLLALTRMHGGKVYAKGPPLTLFVDIKSDAESTYAALDKVLSRYAEMLTTVHAGRSEPKAVTVVISGNRPQKTIAEQALRYAAIDGRLSDLESDAPSHLIPIISDNWGLHFKWKGQGAIPPEERQELADIAKKAHQKGRRLRLWATPESAAVWRELNQAGVDLINTDDLAGLERFLRGTTGER